MVKQATSIQQPICEDDQYQLSRIVNLHLTENQKKELHKVFKPKSIDTQVFVDAQIKRICSNEAPSESCIEKLWSIKTSIYEFLTEQKFLDGEEWDLVIYGSALNSIFSKNASDLDLTLVIHSKIDYYKLLEQVMSILKAKVNHFDSF
jgi:hypothetical protein